MIARRLLVLVTVVAAAGCSGNESDSSTTAADEDVVSTTADSNAPDDAEEQSEPSSDTTDAPRPGAVAFDGSVESLILMLPDARNFADGVEAWLGAVPGQEGVLRNSRGITVFVPVDEGFPQAAADAAFADPDAAAVTIGDHLHVGALEELDGTVVVATGLEFEVGDDGETVGGRRVLRAETATNGVVYLIDGPLAGTAG